MKTTKLVFLPVALGTIVIGLGVNLSSASAAGLVYINSSKVTILGETGAVAGAKYKISNGNFDQSLDRGTGTTSGNFISNNLGNIKALSNTAFDFSFQHLTGQGYIFTMTNTTNPSRIYTLSWGTFTPPPGANTTTSKTTTLLNGVAPDTEAFHAIKLEARAQNPGSSMTFSNLQFISDDHALSIADGAFLNDTVALTTVDNPNTKQFSSCYNTLNNLNLDAKGCYGQWIVSDSDLGDYDWTVKGTLTGVVGTQSNPEEFLRFVVNPKKIDYIIRKEIPPQSTPEHSPTLGLIAMGILGAGSVLKRKFSRETGGAMTDD